MKCAYLPSLIKPGLLAVAALLWLPALGVAASLMTAGQDSGYSERVLEKIASKWRMPAISKGNYRVGVILGVDGDGRLLECKVRTSSGLKSLDESACEAARSAAPFGAPPYAVPSAVYLTFWTGTPGATSQAVRSESGRSAAAPKKAPDPNKDYIAKATKELRQSIYIPIQAPPGVYHVTARIKISPAGEILDSSIIKSSGNKYIDQYTLAGLRRAKSIPTPPKNIGDTLDLPFTLTRR